MDRVKVVIDDPATDEPGPPVDVGAEDFTIEWWMRAERADNRAGAIECGPDNYNWINGNILIDRDRYLQDRKFGVSLGEGRVVFGVSGDGTGHHTICGTSNVADGAWHHVAVQRSRSDGEMTLFVDGRMEARATGPRGDISYPDDGEPADHCDGPCLRSDPYLVLGAEKHDVGPEYPSYSGLLDELRISTTIRYSGPFEPPSEPFRADSMTAALWHFDSGQGNVLVDSSLHGSSHGRLMNGGPFSAPRWVPSGAPLR